jgi:hypothetical protein
MPRQNRDPIDRFPTISDRLAIAFKSFYRYNTVCPERAWPDGSLRLKGEEHFNENGACKFRKEKS